jgi:hypothetical protein
MINPAIMADAMAARAFIFERLIAIGTASTKCTRIRSARESYSVRLSCAKVWEVFRMVATRGLGCLRPGSIFGHKKTRYMRG